MKVLHVNEHLAHKGGVETYLFGLLPRLEERGVAPVVAYGDGDPALHEPVRHVPALGTVGFRAEAQARSQMEDLLREEAPDVIHVHNTQNVGALQASLDYGPTVVTTHDGGAVVQARLQGPHVLRIVHVDDVWGLLA